MGSYARLPEWESEPSDESTEATETLGSVLSGRFAEVDIDSVEAVREVRERR